MRNAYRLCQGSFNIFLEKCTVFVTKKVMNKFVEKPTFGEEINISEKIISD